MIVVDQRVGLLVEVRLVAPVSDDDFLDMIGRVRGIVRGSSDPVAFCTDWRGAGLLPDSVVEPFIWMMRQDNPGISRTAVYVGESGSRQAQQMVDEAKSDRRRCCHTIEEVLDFLMPVTTSAERSRAEEFLRSPTSTEESLPADDT